MIRLRDYQQDLYNGILNEFRKGNRRVLAQSPCRSGKSYVIAKLIEDLTKGKALLIAHRIELLNQLSGFLVEEGLNYKVYVESVFTEARRLDKSDITLIIIDEAHLSGAKSYHKVVEAYPNAYVVGFTATPTRLDGKRLDLYHGLITGISVKSLIKKGAISQFDYYAPAINLDLSEIDTRMGDYVIGQLDDLMTKSRIYGDVIKAYRKLGGGKQAIAYCVSVKHSLKVCEEFSHAGIRARHIDGSMRKNERKRIMDDFRNGDFDVLCNCNIISEGITLPDVEVAILLRPTQSLALYIQQSMRCMTPKEGKRAVIIDCVGNYQRHGLPDDDREWTLDGVTKKHKEFNDEGEFTIRMCPQCFKVFKTASRCPYCGYKIVPVGREIEQMKEVEFAKIKEREEAKKANKRRQVGRARTRAELEAIAKERGYNPYWVKIMCKAKKIPY